MKTSPLVNMCERKPGAAVRINLPVFWALGQGRYCTALPLLAVAACLLLSGCSWTRRECGCVDRWATCESEARTYRDMSISFAGLDDPELRKILDQTDAKRDDWITAATPEVLTLW